MVLGLETGINTYIIGGMLFVSIIAYILYGFINKTVGFSYAMKLYRMKNKNNENKILLKIWLPNGKPQYIIKETANLIEYDYKENGMLKRGMVKYDYMSMYRDFSGIPMLECDPNDIVPRNPFINTSLTISGQILKKNIVDSAKEDLSKESIKSYVKIALPIIIAVGIILILYSSNQSDALAQCMSTALNAQKAIIVGG